MTDPTIEMVEAARRTHKDVSLRGSSGGDWSVDPMRAALDAALKARG